MIDNQVIFSVEERQNVHQKRGKEWALSIQFVGYERWTMEVWSVKPTESTIERAKVLVMRSFEVYHRHLKIPPFDISIIDIERELGVNFEREMGNLLAVLHRDGGHYITEHGWRKAIDDGLQLAFDMVVK